MTSAWWTRRFHATVFAAQTEAGRERYERQAILVESDAIEKAGG